MFGREGKHCARQEPLSAAFDGQSTMALYTISIELFNAPLLRETVRDAEAPTIWLNDTRRKARNDSFQEAGDSSNPGARHTSVPQRIHAYAPFDVPCSVHTSSS